MIEKFIDLFQLLVELKESKSTPEKYEKELDRNIRFVKEIIENPKLINKEKGRNVFMHVLTFLTAYFNSQ